MAVALQWWCIRGHTFEGQKAGLRFAQGNPSENVMKILAIIGACVAAVLLVGYLWRRVLGGGESERMLSRDWEGPNSGSRNSWDNR
jgi:hypothetical protein